MAQSLDWKMIRDMELTALDQPLLDTNTIAASARQNEALTDSEVPIILEIGERRFKVLPSTLSDGSTYFASFFSGRWKQTKLADGSIFIDGDGDSFEHLLRFLRLKEKPLFWNRATGFDTQKYNALRLTADYFGVTELSEWIKRERYAWAVSITETRSMGFSDYLPPHTVEVHHDDLKVTYIPHGGMKREYKCPRGVHDGDLVGCRQDFSGKLAQNRVGEVIYEDVDSFKMLVVREKAAIDWGKLQ